MKNKIFWNAFLNANNKNALALVTIEPRPEQILF